MKNCSVLSQQLLVEYQEKSKATRFPKIFISRIESAEQEYFVLDYAGGVLTVSSSNITSDIYALSLLNIVVPSGHWPEFLGPSKPRLSVRPLWLLNPPKTEEEFHKTSQRVLALGFNAILIDGLSEFLHIPKQYGLKVILKANSLPDDLDLTEIDYVFWEGHYAFEESDKTQVECILADICRIEGVLRARRRLIYFIPYRKEHTEQQNAQLILSLCAEVSATTCLSFSIVMGDPTHDHLAFHPFWKLLRTSPSLRGTNFFPVFNAGGVHQGEGLWPSVSFDLAEQLISGCQRHSFGGAIGILNALPVGGFAEANLWMMNQALWREMPPKNVTEVWLRTNKSGNSVPAILQVLEESRRLILAINSMQYEEKFLPQEEKRQWGELNLLQLQFLEKKVLALSRKWSPKGNEVPFGDYFFYFAKDIKRFLKRCIPSLNVDVDFQDSIWTVGAPKNEDPFFLANPNTGHTHPQLAKIFAENYE